MLPFIECTLYPMIFCCFVSRFHTIALVEPSKIYSFGRGDQGQLGNGKIINQSVPLPVHLPPGECAEKQIEGIRETVMEDDNASDHSLEQRVRILTAGGNLSFALCDPAQVSWSRIPGSYLVTFKGVLWKWNENDRCILFTWQDCKKPKPTVRRVAVLHEKKIDRWISASNSSWKEIMRQVFGLYLSEGAFFYLLIIPAVLRDLFICSDVFLSFMQWHKRNIFICIKHQWKLPRGRVQIHSFLSFLRNTLNKYTVELYCMLC